MPASTLTHHPLTLYHLVLTCVVIVHARWDNEMPTSSFFDNECDLDERDREHRRRSSSETGASSSSRRARIIVQLSDSEEDEEEEEEEGEEEAVRRGEEEGRGRERREGGHRAGNDEEEDNEEEDEEEEGEGGDEDGEGAPGLSRHILPWWQRKWPRAMLREKESRWRLADHCRSRTQLYHTLLHYKFRLFLKVGQS